MRKLFVTILLGFLFILPIHQAEAMNPRMKVMLTTAGYGTVGGALLGTAALAFGASSRAIFQGASIGLYAGLIFGGYILYSHSQGSQGYQNEQIPIDTESPYNEGSEGGSFDTYQRWSDPYQNLRIDVDFSQAPQLGKKESSDDFSFHIPLLLYQF